MERNLVILDKGISNPILLQCTLLYAILYYFIYFQYCDHPVPISFYTRTHIHPHIFNVV